MIEQRIVHYEPKLFTYRNPRTRFEREAKKLAKDGWRVQSVTTQRQGVMGLILIVIGV